MEQYSFQKIIFLLNLLFEQKIDLKPYKLDLKFDRKCNLGKNLSISGAVKKKLAEFATFTQIWMVGSGKNLF